MTIIDRLVAVPYTPTDLLAMARFFSDVAESESGLRRGFMTYHQHIIIGTEYRDHLTAMAEKHGVPLGEPVYSQFVESGGAALSAQMAEEES